LPVPLLRMLLLLSIDYWCDAAIQFAIVPQIDCANAVGTTILTNIETELDMMPDGIGSNVALKAFLMILLMELGDKTQLASIALSADSRRPFSVLLGAVAALALVTLIGVLIGDALTRIIPMNRINQIAGLLFVAIGVLMYMGKF